MLKSEVMRQILPFFVKKKKKNTSFNAHCRSAPRGIPAANAHTNPQSSQGNNNRVTGDKNVRNTPFPRQNRIDPRNKGPKKYEMEQ